MNQEAIYGDRSAPSYIDDDFALTAASQLRRQTILLYSGFGISIPGIIAIADPSSSPLFGLLVPLAILGSALAGLYVLLRYRPDRMNPLAARKFLARITKFSITIVALGRCGVWKAGSPPRQKFGYIIL